MNAQVPAARRTRGPTKCLRIWEIRSPEDRIRVRINRNGQPVGRTACSFTRFLGTVARKGNLAPIDLVSWHDMPIVNKDHMWGIVQEKFIFHPVGTETMKGWTLKNIAEKWRGYKADLKARYYDETSTIADIVDKAAAEREVDKSQFEKLMNRWRTVEAKHIYAFLQNSSEQNSQNRAKHDQAHIVGTKSFARLADEMEEELKREPARSEIYVKTRVREDGTFSSNASKTVVENINKINSAGTTENGDSSQDVLAKALEKPEKLGHELCIGMLPPSTGRRRAPSGPGESSISSQVHQELKNQYDQVQKENEQIKDYLKSISEKIGVPLGMFLTLRKSSNFEVRLEAASIRRLGVYLIRYAFQLGV